MPACFYDHVDSSGELALQCTSYDCTPGGGLGVDFQGSITGITTRLHIQSTICTVTWRLFSPSLTVGLHFSSILLCPYLLSEIMFPTSVASLRGGGSYVPTLNTSVCFPCGHHDGYQDSRSCFAKKLFVL